MDTLEAILSRRSIRHYTGERATEEEEQKILKAAWAAPVGMGRKDDMYLTVITNPDLLSGIESCAAAAMGNPGAKLLYGAPEMVLVSVRLSGDEPADNVQFSNAAGAIENMALEAVDLGLGTVHIWGAIRALSKSPELIAKLRIPDGYTPVSAVLFGRSNETYRVRSTEGRYQTEYLR